ncbi:Transcriptional regulator, contains XRE-family HTH domain [Lentzea flava]|nr:Transcriptional regulator, contains XRE-family HTH domain [Lentzea flava]
MQTVISRMKALRTQRGLTAQGLAEAMTKAGVPWEVGVVTKLETGRRKSVSVAELFGLAAALRVSPLTLLLPELEAEYHVTPSLAAPAARVAQWLQGLRPLPSQDQEDEFYDTLPGYAFPPPTSDEEQRKALERLRGLQKQAQRALDAVMRSEGYITFPEEPTTDEDHHERSDQGD